MLQPRSETDLSEAIKSTQEPVRIVGGGTRAVGVTSAEAQLSVAGLTGISLYEPGALTIVAAAGTPLSEINEVLSRENQRLPFEPMDMRGLLGTSGEPTIGGVVATNASGPRRIQAGAARDSLIGVRFVDGEGTIIKNGGRVMKNVTGYDLVKLMAGSYGTLGVLTEVAFKVLPATSDAGVLTIEGVGPAEAVAVMSKALGSPFEVSAAAYASGDTPTVMIRIEGFEASVDYRAGQLRLLLEEFGSVQIERDPAKADQVWAAVRDVQMFHGTGGDVWRISVKPSDGAAVAERLGGAPYLLDWGGGLIWAEVPTGTDLRRKLEGIAGHATLIRAPEETKRALGVFHPEAAPLAAISGGIRSKFDPRGILNPGMMG